MRGAGRVAFAAWLLLIVGMINIIYGIGAIEDPTSSSMTPGTY